MEPLVSAPPAEPKVPPVGRTSRFALQSLLISVWFAKAFLFLALPHKRPSLSTRMADTRGLRFSLLSA